MNYYYEFPEDVSVLGHPGGGYYCLANQSPAQGYKPLYATHDYGIKYAKRVWMENANGVTMLKPSWPGKVDEREFVMVKLKARILNE